MRIQWRDAVATLLVVIAFAIFSAWSLGAVIPGFEAAEAVALVVLVLGIAASAVAVVPRFGELLHGSRLYLAAASTLGVLALGAALCTILGGAPGLPVLVVTTVVLWAMATARHAGRLRPQRIGHR